MGLLVWFFLVSDSHASLKAFGVLFFIVLTRSEEDGIGVEELDAIQSDLETLLAAAGLRLKQLENEKQILVNWADKKDIKGFKSSKVHSTVFRTKTHLPERDGLCI